MIDIDEPLGARIVDSFGDPDCERDAVDTLDNIAWHRASIDGNEVHSRPEFFHRAIDAAPNAARDRPVKDNHLAGSCASLVEAVDLIGCQSTP